MILPGYPAQVYNPTVTTTILITLLILAAAAILMLSERLRPDLVALLVVVALGITGVLTPREAFSGFASSAVVTIASIFILVEALRVTRLTEHAGDVLLRVGGTRERSLVATVMAAGARTFAGDEQHRGGGRAAPDDSGYLATRPVLALLDC